MSKIPDTIDTQLLKRLADESGLAIAIVDDNGHQTAVLNNNSICRNLNPGEGFSTPCARFCGQALEKALEAGKTIGFVCHAGLDCRTFAKSIGGKQHAIIVGRTFLKAENYRKATERAITGDWSEFPPSDFFENVLLTGSVDVLNRTAEQVNELWVEADAPGPPDAVAAADVEPDPVPRPEQDLPPLIEARPQGIVPETKQIETRTAESRAWRSFFGSILKTDYARASASILEFIAHQYGFSSLVWLRRTGDHFENAATFGEMKSRTVRLGILPDDPRLVSAFHNEEPLELGERAKDHESGAARTMNLFPIGVDGDISAAIAILDPMDTDDQKRQIARICHSIAPQLEILRLRNEVSGRDALANAVKNFSESLKGIDADDFWLNLTQNAAEMLRAERASLLILDEKSGDLEIKAMIGAMSMPAGAGDIGARVAKIVLGKNQPALVSDVSRTGLPPAPDERKYRTGSFLSFPINIGFRTIGVMNFTDRVCGKAFDKNSLELFQAIAPQLAVAIDRATLKEKAGEFEQLSVTDALTGLLNRRYIEERLMEEIKRSNRHGFPMSFMMLDVDHFKSYNDEHGHPAGDEALKIVAHVIRETLRGADVAARFGGEEFAILLPQTTGEEAKAIAERIRSNIEEAEFPRRKVTASIGVASCSADLCISADLVSAADKALYAAKHHGRNKVIAFEDLNGEKA